MIGDIRNSIITKTLWGLMGIYLLNISVDTADPNPANLPEDLSINDQESIVEIVLEKVLGFENAIEEYDDNDTEDHNEKTNFKIDLTSHYAADNTLDRSIIITTKHKFPDYSNRLIRGFRRLDIPPPKV